MDIEWSRYKSHKVSIRRNIIQVLRQMGKEWARKKMGKRSRSNRETTQTGICRTYDEK